MKMFDLVRQRRFNYGRIVNDPDLQNDLLECVPFYAQNVADYMTTFAGKALDPTMFPVAMPPFNRTWVEFSRASWMAVHTLVMNYEDEVKDVTDKRFPVPVDTKFLLWSRVFSSPSNRKVQGPIGTCITPLDKDGVPLFVSDGRPCFLKLEEEYDHIDPNELEREIGSCLAITLATFCFTHMKNVTIQTAEVEPRLARAYERRHGVKPAQFRVITLDPVKELLRKEGRIHEVGLKQALHLVRGHFAVYTKEKPLFGKHIGRFYRHAHVAGSAEFGINLPSYVVKASR